MTHRLVLLAVAACSTADAAYDHSTPYRCDGIAIADQDPSASPELAAPWRALADDTAGSLVDRAAALAAQGAPTRITTEDRVRLQHQMLRVAARLDREASYIPTTPGAADARRAVTALALAVAPTAHELDRLGDGAHPQVSAVLGPDIVERSTVNCSAGNLVHNYKFRGLLSFRPLRAGTTRALVAQIVAFDTDGAPRITPLVDDIEMRRDDNSACVVAAGDDGVLRTVAHADLEQSPFVHRDGGGVSCHNCHSSDTSFSPRDITDAHELDDIDGARFGQVDRLAIDTWARFTAKD